VENPTLIEVSVQRPTHWPVVTLSEDRFEDNLHKTFFVTLLARDFFHELIKHNVVESRAFDNYLTCQIILLITLFLPVKAKEALRLTLAVSKL